MAFKIIWSKRAENDLKKVIEYLNTEWSDYISESFVSSLIDKLDLLIEFPLSGVTIAEDSTYRKIVVTKHNTLFYHIEKLEIRILRVFDTRQHPQKLKLRLKK